MEPKQIKDLVKDLISLMKKEGIKKIALKDKGGFELLLESQEDQSESSPQALASPPHPSHLGPHHLPPFHAYYPPIPLPHREQPAASPSEGVVQVQEQKESRYITSPFVGTFYTAPSPEDPPFIKVGDRIEENTVICIIEAMKVMNEVKAGVSGTVAEILLKNADPVEFGTKILRVV
jgi:acetyl-CoA carboxylase biotin carboxyl carrier protein